MHALRNLQAQNLTSRIFSSQDSAQELGSASSAEDEQDIGFDEGMLAQAHSGKTNEGLSDSSTTKDDAGSHQVNDVKIDSSSDGKASHYRRNKHTRPRVQEIYDKGFHLFYWLAAIPDGLSKPDQFDSRQETTRSEMDLVHFTVDNQLLTELIAQLHLHLRKTRRAGRHAYHRCPSQSLDEIEIRYADIDRSAKPKKRAFAAQRASTQLEEATEMEGGEHQEDEDEIEDDRKEEGQGEEEEKEELTIRSSSYEARNTRFASNYEGAVEDEIGSKISNLRRSPSPRLPRARSYVSDDLDAKFRFSLPLAKQLFTFFFPLAFSSDTTRKYWGAVDWILHVSLK